ncbi:MAG TPA: sigma-70 family RNA polymerase sigma factor [Gaiellaceae bacterium]
MSAAAQSPIAISVVGLGAPWSERRMSPAVPQRSDEELVEAVARADEDALGELYDRFGRVAYGLAFKILRDASLAEDAVQEAFLQAWRGAGAYQRDRAKAGTWLLTFVHRRAVDLVRREERRRTVPADSAPEPSGPGSDETVVARSRGEVVRSALSRLPDEQREAIELAYYGGLTQSELAERLGQPLGTIKSRMFTGLQRLRVLLAEAGYESA